MKRRQVLAACSALPVALSGCSADSSPSTESPTEGTTTNSEKSPAGSTVTTSQTRRQPPFDGCSESEVTRPEPPTLEPEDAIQPLEYPGPPPTPLDEQSAIEYVERFEKAYRQNLEVRKYADDEGWATSLSVGTIDTWTYDAPTGAAVVRLEYVYSGRFKIRGEGPGNYDSINQFVSYYVDGSIVVRAATTQYDVADGDVLSPDPWESGELVACFEE